MKKNIHEVHLFNSSEFVSLTSDNGGLILTKVDEDHKYNPSKGALLKDVNIYKNTQIDSIHITGKSYCVVKPDLNMLSRKMCLVNLENMEKLVAMNSEDVIFKFWKFAIIKRQYYYLSKPSSINRCYFFTPISILNCKDEDEAGV